MNDDLLSEAVRALREETSGPADDDAMTRARVMTSLHGSKRRRNWRLAVLMPIAAVLVGSTAFAGWGKKPLSWQDVAVAVGIREPQQSPERALPRVFARANVSRGGARLEQTREPAPQPVPEVLEPAPAEVPSGASSTRGLARAEPRPSRPVSPELELYRSAHALHFSGANPAAALAAWDAYLAHAPRGRFATEAQYNRAICLARLGRTAEARQALEPFASGRYGEYRRDSARTLLDALGAL